LFIEHLILEFEGAAPNALSFSNGKDLMMHHKIWKVALLNWVLLAAAANSNPNQPNWKIAGSYANATDCLAAIGGNLATSSVVSGIAGWASSELGAASGTGVATSSGVTPFVCVPANHPWVASIKGAASGSPGQGGQSGNQPAQ
jgi:hypothetical protein